jgi:hypothetical protein
VSRAELLAGLRRLGLVLVALVAFSGLCAAGFVAFGASARSGMSAGSGVVGVLLVVCGLGAFLRTQPARRAEGGIHVVERLERREAESLSGGLLGLGIVFCAVSLGIG